MVSLIKNAESHAKWSHYAGFTIVAILNIKTIKFGLLLSIIFIYLLIHKSFSCLQIQTIYNMKITWYWFIRGSMLTEKLLRETLQQTNPLHWNVNVIIKSLICLHGLIKSWIDKYRHLYLQRNLKLSKIEWSLNNNLWNFRPI